MNTPLPDDRLADLIRDAVDDIEPTDRLDAIRARTAHSPARAARPWWYAAGGAALATAAAVTAFAVLGDRANPDAGHSRHDVATDPAPTSELVAVYFPGETPSGPRLFREFDRVPPGDVLQSALDRLQQPPSDPDYQTTWPSGTLRSARLSQDGIDVEVGDIQLELGPRDPVVQQVVYTLQAAIAEQLPVRFVQDGTVVLGPVAADPDVLSPVSISDPAEGNDYSGSLIARGRATSPTGSATWTLRQGDQVAVDGSVTVGTDSLERWEVSIDLSGVAPGTYTFELTQDSPPDDYFVPSTDTRTITVR